MGFGGSTSIQSTMESFTSICSKYSNAIETKIDVWQIKLTLAQGDGMILQNTIKGKQIEKDKNGHKIEIFLKSFINYFSLGYDARVGFGFEKSRSGSRCCNKMIYMWEGCKKNCCRKTMRIKGFLKSFQIMIPKKNEISPFEEKLEVKLDADPALDEEKPQDIQELNSQRVVKNDSYYCVKNDHEKIADSEDINNTIQENQFEMKDIFVVENEKGEVGTNVVLKGDPVSLVCQNINFYMGGTGDIWKKSKDQLGVEIISNKKTKEEDITERRKTIGDIGVEKQQSFNDQKLEFFTYDSGLTIGMEKVVTGLADKVYSGEGPILITFKDTPSHNDKDKKNRIYMNIDGEFFNVVKPLSLRVRLNTKILNGQIPFLQYSKNVKDKDS